MGKSWISKEQSPKVVRSKSSIASTSRSNVELGNAVWEFEVNSKSIDDVDVDKDNVVVEGNEWKWREFDVDDEDDEIEVGIEKIFFFSFVDFDLFIWWRIIATTIRRNNGLERSIVFNCLLNFDDIIWSNSKSHWDGDGDCEFNDGDFDNDEYVLSIPWKKTLN